jgi:glycosyltransferase involved in cell wall biosynthesis
MRRVLFVHNGPLYRSADGGFFGTHYSETVKQRYLQLGDHVTFLMRERPLSGDTSGYSRIEASQFSFVPVPDLLSPLGRIRNSRAALRVVDREVNAADVVVARIPSLTARLAVARARTYGKPYLVECVACNWDALWNHHWKASLSAPWYYLAQKSVVRKSPYVIYVTTAFLQSRYPTRGKNIAISNVDIPAPDDAVLKRRLRRIAAGARSAMPLRLVTVADVSVPYKGQADVIRALGQLAEAGIDAEYHLVGGGDPQRLRTLARKLGVEGRVVFHGSLEHSRVFALLDDMDVYIQPSRQEGLPRAVIEAMSRALPCAGARTGGIPELIADDRVFAPGSLDEIVSIITKLRDKERQSQDSRQNFSRAKDYGRDRLSSKRNQFYREFLEDQLS